MPTFKNKYLNDIDAEVLIDFYNLKLNNLNTKTQRDILVLLNQILKFGGSNERAFCPKVTNKKVDIINDEEIILLEKYMKDNLNSITLSFIVALYSGIRIGEICALKWSDIDLDNKFINIDKTLNRIKDLDNNSNKKAKIVITPPKSEKSIRTIPIPSFLCDLFLKVKSDSVDESYFLTNSNKYIEPRLLRNKFKAILKKLNFDKKFHTLRHTFATKSIELGFDAKTLSELLGHSNIRTTLNLYVHPTNIHKIECMNKFELLSSQKNINN